MTACLYQRSITERLLPTDESRYDPSSYRVMTDKALSKHGLERLHTGMARHVASGAVPGFVSVVSRKGEVDVDVQGAMSAEPGAPTMQRDAIFRISSMSKPVTAVATMILLEDCVIRLDDP